jgi:hypothetical protein
MSALLRRLCMRLDDFHDRHPVISFSIAIAVCIACELAIGYLGDKAMPPVITHIGGFQHESHSLEYAPRRELRRTPR